jgi:hypothetical protein
VEGKGRSVSAVGPVLTVRSCRVCAWVPPSLFAGVGVGRGSALDARSGAIRGHVRTSGVGDSCGSRVGLDEMVACTAMELFPEVEELGTVFATELSACQVSILRAARARLRSWTRDRSCRGATSRCVDPSGRRARKHSGTNGDAPQPPCCANWTDPRFASGTASATMPRSSPSPPPSSPRPVGLNPVTAPLVPFWRVEWAPDSGVRCWYSVLAWLAVEATRLAQGARVSSPCAHGRDRPWARARLERHLGGGGLALAVSVVCHVRRGGAAVGRRDYGVMVPVQALMRRASSLSGVMPP